MVCCILLLFAVGCKQQNKQPIPTKNSASDNPISYAKGFSIAKETSGITIITISSPWPEADAEFKYALIPREKLATVTLNKAAYDAIVTIPIERVVATSTTHIPALEALGVENRLVGFPNTDYISSKTTRERIEAGEIKELGNNEDINPEMTLELQPDLVVGFSINNQNKAYETLRRSNIPVVYNGDWTEETPLGKAEWIKFFAPFFQMERKADSIFKDIAASYTEAQELAKKANSNPKVLSGALYKDVWYMPGGNSWAAQFLKDANSNYLWSATDETGSLSLSIESVLEKAQNADFWVSPSQFTSYQTMKEANRHYLQFDAFKNRRIYTFAKTTGATGGLLYYELAPQRPDLVLKDLIHILHPELLPKHELFFFKPLD